MTKFQFFRKGFCKLLAFLWLTVIKKIFRFPFARNPFAKRKFCMHSCKTTSITQFKDNKFGIYSRLLETDFIS